MVHLKCESLLTLARIAPLVDPRYSEILHHHARTLRCLEGEGGRLMMMHIAPTLNRNVKSSIATL